MKVPILFHIYNQKIYDCGKAATTPGLSARGSGLLEKRAVIFHTPFFYIMGIPLKYRFTKEIFESWMVFPER